MKSRLSVVLTGLWVLCAHMACGISATLVPEQIHPGDIFRLEVVRSDTEFAEFDLDIPQFENLHLLGIEESPLVLRDGQYIQKESWIFQADVSGEIDLSGITARVVYGSTEETVGLPQLKLSVIPYAASDTDSAPIDWSTLHEEQPSGPKWVYALILLLVAGTATYLVLRHNRQVSSSEPVGTTLWDTAIADLEKGLLNPDSLHLLYERNGQFLSQPLRNAIEQAIYANRGDASKLADAIRKEASR